MEYLPRIIEEKLDKWLPRGEVLLLKGPRQSGKTTLLRHLEEKYGGKYITLEIEDYAEAIKKDPITFAKRFLPYKILYVDEAQYVKDIGRYIKIIYDEFKGRLKLVITGSGSFEVKENLGKYLVGRAIYFELFPLSFAEFLLWKNKELFELYKEYAKSLWDFAWGNSSTLKEPIFIQEFFKLLKEFILFGGYPAVVKEKEVEVKKELLQNLLQTYLEKDIFFFLNIRQFEKFKSLLKALSFKIGSLLEISSLTKELKLDFKTAENYLSILTHTYVLELIPSFHKNLITELKKSKKVYFLDTGLRNSLLRDFKELEHRIDRGELLENFVYVELRKKGYHPYFWRTSGKAEIDFILTTQEKLLPIEVKVSPKLTRGFYSFLKAYKPQRALILSWIPQTKIYLKNATLLGIIPLFCV